MCEIFCAGSRENDLLQKQNNMKCGIIENSPLRIVPS